MKNKITIKHEGKEFEFNFKLLDENNLSSGEWIKHEIIDGELKKCSQGNGYTYDKFMSTIVMGYL